MAVFPSKTANIATVIPMRNMMDNDLTPKPSDKWWERVAKRQLLFEQRHLFLNITINIGLGLLGSAASNLLGPVIQKFVTLLIAAYWGRLLIELIFIAAGIALFQMRRKLQRVYGSLECIVAVAASWLIIQRLAPRIQPEDVIGLAAAGYIMVRGMTNIVEGHEKARATELNKQLQIESLTSTLPLVP